MVGKPVTLPQPGKENAFLKLKVTDTLELKWVCEGQRKEGHGEEGLTHPLELGLRVPLGLPYLTLAVIAG